MNQSIITKQQHVLDLVKVSVEQLLVDKRVFDTTLPIGEIERMIINGELTVDQLVNRFKTSLLCIIGKN